MKKSIGNAKSDKHEMTLYVEDNLYTITFDGLQGLSASPADKAKAKWESYLKSYQLTETEKPRWPKPKPKPQASKPSTSRRRSW